MKMYYEDLKGEAAVDFENTCAKEHEFDFVLTDRVASERFDFYVEDLAKYSVRKNGNDVCFFKVYEPITEDQASVLPIYEQNEAVMGVLLDFEFSVTGLDMNVIKAVIEFVKETYGTFSMAPVSDADMAFISSISDDDAVSDCTWSDRGFGVYTFYGRPDGDLVQPWRDVVPESDLGPLSKEEFVDVIVNTNSLQNDDIDLYISCFGLDFNASIKIVDALGYDWFDSWVNMTDKFGDFDDGCDGFLPSNTVYDDPDNTAWDYFYDEYLESYEDRVGEGV